jgi:LruC domain-containing protein
LCYQNCARIGYADANGNINKNAIDGTLGGNNPPGGSNVVQFPDANKNKMTVAFEDLMTTSNRSTDTDVDYNDFVFTYNVREESLDGYLKKIEITVVPQAREASYEAQLLLSLKGALDSNCKDSSKPAFLDSEDVEAKIEYFDQNDKLVSSRIIDVSKTITIFQKTSQVFTSLKANLDAGTSGSPIKVVCQESAKLKAKITITGFIKRDENLARPTIEVSRYPFFLYVEPTQTMMGTVDLNPTHKTKDGYPLGFQFPGTFLHTADRVNVKSVYPYFSDYLKLINGVSLDAATKTKAEDWANWLQPDWATKLACSPAAP